MGVDSNANFIYLLRVLKMLIDIHNPKNDDDLTNNRYISNHNEIGVLNHRIVKIEVNFTEIQLETSNKDKISIFKLQFIIQSIKRLDLSLQQIYLKNSIGS
eukprot:403340457